MLEGWGSLVWVRPAGFAFLLLPLLLWWLGRRAARTHTWLTGTVELWRAVAARPEARARARRARRAPLPPPVRWILAALVLGALGLAGPRWRGPTAVPRWTVVVDTSPSMRLPLDPDARSAGPTRLERALARAADVLGRRAGTTARVRWRAPGRPDLELAGDALPPATWWAPLPGHDPAPAWAFHDRPWHLWLTDDARVPRGLEPRHAGWIAVGGEPVPGPVAEAGNTLYGWDGEPGAPLRAIPAPAPARALVLDPATPAPLAALAELWATERGFTVRAAVAGTPPGPDHPGRVVLRVEGRAPGPGDVLLEARRGGWWLRGTGARLDALDGDATGDAVWLWSDGTGEERTPLVLRRPGRLRLAWSTLEEPGGDPVAFALDWSRLFEAAALPHPAVVPLDERGDAGAAEERLPADAGGDADRTGGGVRAGPEALLAVASFLSGLLGVLLAALR